MAFVRILVDGYSLLHYWGELAPHKPRFSAAAREELIQRLLQYNDATSIPITVVFDGTSGGAAREGTPSSSDVEILYSHTGQTADQIIERAAHRLIDYGEVLVVTDDMAERNTVESAGALSSSCANFVRAIEAVREQFERDLRRYNLLERNKFLNTI